MYEKYMVNSRQRQYGGELNALRLVFDCLSRTNVFTVTNPTFSLKQKEISQLYTLFCNNYH